MQHVEPAADEATEVEPVRQPRREAEQRLDAGRIRGERGDGTAHREADQERAWSADFGDCGPDVLLAELEPLPRLDPVANLGEAEFGKAGSKATDEPFERRTPRSLDLGGLAAVCATRPSDRRADR